MLQIRHHPGLPLPRYIQISAFLILLSISTGCLRTTTRVQTVQPKTLQTATLDELLEKLRSISSVDSMKATVEMQLSVLNEERTKRDDWTDVKGFVLGRRPGLVRIQAQVPYVGGKAFDMASNGDTFRVHLAWRNEVVEGENRMDKRSEKRAENVRPQHILEPLLIDPPAGDETAVLDNHIEGLTAYQIVQLQRAGSDGVTRITRKAWFERVGLTLARLEIYDDKGEIVTRARYKGWNLDGETPYAQEVFVSRPLDGYDLTVRFVSPGLNESVPDSSFDLEIPEGAKVRRVGEEETEDKPQP